MADDLDARMGFFGTVEVGTRSTPVRPEVVGTVHNRDAMSSDVYRPPQGVGAAG
jgi:hypothetical protein